MTEPTPPSPDLPSPALPSPALPSPVLIACDDAEARATTASALGRCACDTLEAEDADQALDLLQARRDIRGLVVAAQQLGMMTGCELARLAEREWPYIRHVVVLGRGPPGPGELPLGAHYLLRPLDVDAVIHCLRQPAAPR